VPWAKAPEDTGRFPNRAEHEEVYSIVKPGDDIIAYSPKSERSSHTWFVLTYLLGIPGVRNYDGSWTEWGNTVRVPIVAGDKPGSVPGSAPA
jgi:thiosulfate/3-mercaptopyruvate sulfurtransferase